MKKILFASLVFLFCGPVTMAQKEKIEGNGNLVTRDVAVTSFEALKASGVYELKLTQGNTESVRIEADENLQQYFDVRNEGNKLVISMKDTKNKSWNVKNKMRVYVTFRNLKDLELSTVGNVQAENELKLSDLSLRNKSVGNVKLQLTANKVDIENKSVGNIQLTGKAQDAVVRNSGVGNLDAGSFLVQSMNIENTGVGSAVVNASKELKVKDSFLGKVNNKGAAPVRKMNRVRV